MSGEDTLQDDRTAAGKMPPLPDEPAQLLPNVSLSVVDVGVDPLGAVSGALATVLLGEDSVRGSNIIANTVVVGVVGVVDGLRGPSSLPGIDGKEEGVVAGVPGAVEERKGLTIND